jgi:hypothetical protein
MSSIKALSNGSNEGQLPRFENASLENASFSPRRRRSETETPASYFPFREMLPGFAISRSEILAGLASYFQHFLCGLRGVYCVSMDFGPQQIGKILIAIGLTIALLGGFFLLLGQIGFFKLPGDLQFGSKNFRVFFPITTCIIISTILTLLMWLISYLHR